MGCLLILSLSQKIMKSRLFSPFCSLQLFDLYSLLALSCLIGQQKYLTTAYFKSILLLAIAVNLKPVFCFFFFYSSKWIWVDVRQCSSLKMTEILYISLGHIDHFETERWSNNEQNSLKCVNSTKKMKENEIIQNNNKETKLWISRKQRMHPNESHTFWP